MTISETKELARRPQETVEARRTGTSNAHRPKGPLARIVAGVVRQQHHIDLSTVEQCDAIQTAAEMLADTSPLDATPIARSLLAATLRLSWVRATGRPNVEPLPEDVPHKLYQAGLLNKAAMQRLRIVCKPDSAGIKNSDLLECSRALIVWLASDPNGAHA